MGVTAGSDAGRASGRPSLATWSLAALAGGLLLGIFGHASHSPVLAKLGDVVKPVGDLWISALLTGHSARDHTGAGAITGVRAESLAARPPRHAPCRHARGALCSRSSRHDHRVPTGRRRRGRVAARGDTPPGRAGTAGAGSLAKWIGSLIPRTSRSRRSRHPRALLLRLFATAASRLPDEQRVPSLFQAPRDHDSKVGWILRAARRHVRLDLRPGSGGWRPGCWAYVVIVRPDPAVHPVLYR
jgi:hypothetical protein